MNAPDLNEVIKFTFHIMQHGKPVSKEVRMTRAKFLEYNAKPKKKWADMYEMIVRDNAYVSITDLTSN